MGLEFPRARQKDLTKTQCRTVDSQEVIKTLGNNIHTMLETNEKFFTSKKRNEVEDMFYKNIIPVLKEYSFNDIFGKCFKYNDVPDDFLPYYDYIIIVDDYGQFDYGTIQLGKKYFWNEGYTAPKTPYMYNSKNEELGSIKQQSGTGKNKFKKVVPWNLHYRFYKKHYTHTPANPSRTIAQKTPDTVIK